MKLKRLLTAALSAVMALGVCAMPAMADYEASPSSIDVTKTGSITIHKYIYNGTESEDNRKGTGSAAADASKVPADVKGLKDVTFTYYQVMNATELVQYYDSLQAGAVNSVTISDYMTSETDWTYNGDKTGDTATTQEGGTVTISGLSVGLYAFFETAAPAGVTEPTHPFLVSLPMTNQQTKNEWMYTIDVYPKNKTAEAGITLQKQGVTGSDVADTKMAGYEFELEKFDETNKRWNSITNNAKDGADNGGDAIAKATDANGQIKISSLTPGIYRFTETGAPADSNYVVDYGTHYLFKVTANSAIAQLDDADKTTIGATAADKNIYDKVNGNTVIATNYKPELEKKIGQDASNDNNTEAADYSIGDMVPYSITVKIPQNITYLAKFEVTDTPTNLEDDTTSIEYYLCDNNGNKTGNAITGADTFATITPVDSTATNGKGFKVTFNSANMAEYAGKTIRIEYKAKLIAQSQTDGDGAIMNPNTAKLTYSNKVNSDKEEDKNSEKTITDETVVYTFKIKIVKTDDSIAPLTGVKFDLYKAVAASTANAVTGSEAGKLGLDTAKSWKKVNTDSIVTGANGEIKYGGLAQGTYYLVETETLEGYNLLSKPVEVTLNKTYAAKWTEKTTYDGNGNVKHHETTVDATKFDDDNSSEAATSFVTSKIINRKGFTLPVTGGFGTLLFSGIGVLLVLAGVSVLFSLKKKNTRA